MIRRLACLIFLLLATPACAATIEVLALGDSLTAGYGLEPAQAFPAKLEAALKARGHDVRIINAGVSGDTAAAGRDRLDWALGERVDAVILELGANDALRGIDPQATRAALADIFEALKGRQLPVLVAGMRAPRNLGQNYAAHFDAIYPELAAAYGASLYPFFLDGVATAPALNQADGLHPNAQGVDVIVARMLPWVEKLLAAAK